MSKITRIQAGELTRSVTCEFCGGEHRRNSKEKRACREAWRKGKTLTPKPEPQPKGERDANRGPSTIRQHDPLGGNPRAHAIAKKLKEGGLTHKRIAKLIGVPVADVERVAHLIKRD